MDEAGRQQILVDNPNRLYGFPPLVRAKKFSAILPRSGGRQYCLPCGLQQGEQSLTLS